MVNKLLLTFAQNVFKIMGLFKGVTQLLDQVNRTLHLRYKNSKRKLFATTRNINRERFMRILACGMDGCPNNLS